MKEIQELLQALNPEQLSVAEIIDGPVSVEAGPGCGKSHMLTTRIANMLCSDAQIDPGSILCLTFTDAGVVSMRQKLLKLIGTDAYKVSVFTFHGFCNDVIQNNQGYFGLKDMEPVSELERISIAEHIIDSLDWNHPLKRITGNQYFETGRLLHLFDLMQRENWSFEFIKQRVNEYTDNMPFDEEFLYKRANSKRGIKAGDFNENKANQIKEKLDKLIAAAGLFNVYESELRRRKRYSFNDMISWTIDAFENNENILRDYQERFLYVSLDERQDQSESQNKVADLIMDFWDTPNILSVGNVFQSIYGFQGANINNITKWDERYNPVKINLTKNYRSTQNIVDAYMNVISKAKDGTYNGEQLVGMNKNAGVVEVRKYSNFEQENAGIAKEICDLIDNGVKPDEISVIYKKHAHADELLRVLYNKKIPITTKRKINVLQEPIVIQLLLILEYLISPEKGEKSDIFFQILHFNFFGVNRKQIERLLILLRDGGSISDLDARSFKTVNSVIKTLDNALNTMHNESLLQLLNELYYSTGIKDILLSSKDSFNSAVLKTFFNFVKEESEKKFDLSVEELLEYIRRMNSNKISLQIEDVISSEAGVNFTTAHGSKGLEFKYVFLIRCNRSDWEKARSVSSLYYLPPTITFSSGDDKLEEARRLFFVAMSRAEQYLYMSFSAKDNKGKDMEPSEFLIDSQIAIRELPEEDVFGYTIESLSPIHREFKPEVEVEKLDIIIENFRMSPSSLNMYMDCPLSFYYEKILRVPYVQSYPAVYGSACHYAINQAHLDKDHTIDDFVQWGINYVEKYGAHLSNKERGRMIKAIKKILPEFHARYMYGHRVILSEFKARDIVIEGVPCYGEIDEMEFDNLYVDVSDYKTGNPINIKNKMVPPKDAEDEGGKYWRQLVFYKLLIDANQKKNWHVRELKVVPINDDPKPIPLAYDPHHDNVVKDQIKRAYSSIKEHKFDGCGKEDCKWCSILK